MAKTSAGLLMYRRREGRTLQVLLVHPGGPFWRKRDDGAWSIPKGEAVNPDEDLLAVARREFREEIGIDPPPQLGRLVPLDPVKLKGGKTVHAWAVEGDLDTAAVRSNTFTMEWPPKSGRRPEFPEIDRAEFFDLDVARRKINSAQAPLLDQLVAVVP